MLDVEDSSILIDFRLFIITLCVGVYSSRGFLSLTLHSLVSIYYVSSRVIDKSTSSIFYAFDYVRVLGKIQDICFFKQHEYIWNQEWKMRIKKIDTASYFLLKLLETMVFLVLPST